jgi:hypothetical protein
MEVIRLTLKDCAKIKVFMLSFAIQLFISIFCLLLVTTQFMDGLSDVLLLNDIKKSDIVSIRMQSASNVIIEDAILKTSLSSVLSEYNTYTWYTISENDYDIIHMFGKYSSLLNGSKQSNDSYLVYGDGVNNKIIELKATEFGIREENIFKQSSFFDSRNGSVSLNKSIMIINQSKTNTFKLDFDQFDQLLHNLHMFNSIEVEIINTVKLLNNDTQLFYPKFVNESSRFEQEFINDLILLLFFSIILVFVIINLYISLYDIVNTNLREYVIHRMYGATMNQITLRIELLTSLVYFVPGYLIAYYLGVFMNTGISPIYYLVILVSGQFIVTMPIRQTILNKNISELLRSDNK